MGGALTKNRFLVYGFFYHKGGWVVSASPCQLRKRLGAVVELLVCASTQS